MLPINTNFSSSVFSRFYEPFDEDINRFIYLLSKVHYIGCRNLRLRSIKPIMETIFHVCLCLDRVWWEGRIPREDCSYPDKGNNVTYGTHVSSTHRPILDMDSNRLAYP